MKEAIFRGSATSISQSSANGKRIGITTVGDSGYIVMYADSSTEEDPVVKVGKYEVHVKDVDPKHATRMEMFALLKSGAMVLILAMFCRK